MNDSVLHIISLIHILTVLFIIGVPFSNSNYLLLLHGALVPFIVIHWYINDDSCILTTIEKQYVNNDINCFTCRIFEPVYNFVDDNKTYSQLIYTITILLIFMSIYKLTCKYRDGEIKNWRQFFIL